jgi:hypothetical protein
MQCYLSQLKVYIHFNQTSLASLLAQSVAYLATSPATKAGGWSLPELPPCPGKVAAMISMTCSTAVFSMKEHSCASSSSRPAGGVLLPGGFAGSCAVCFALCAYSAASCTVCFALCAYIVASCAVCFALCAYNLQTEQQSCVEPHVQRANLLAKNDRPKTWNFLVPPKIVLWCMSKQVCFCQQPCFCPPASLLCFASQNLTRGMVGTDAQMQYTAQSRRM